MASPPFNIAETTPSDGSLASVFPAAERSFRDIVESWLLVNHNVQGRHSVVALDFASEPSGVASVTTIYADATGILKYKVGAGTATIFSGILSQHDTVSTALLDDLGVTTAKINDLAVTTAKINDLGVTTAKIAASNVTYAKIQNMTNGTILGNFSGGAAAPSEYTLGDNLTHVSTALDTKYGPKAWAYCTVSGGTLTQQSGYNCTVTRQSQGEFTCTFSAALNDANYAFISTVDNTLVSGEKAGGTRSTSAVQFHANSVLDSTDPQDPPKMSIVVFGN